LPSEEFETGAVLHKNPYQEGWLQVHQQVDSHDYWKQCWCVLWPDRIALHRDKHSPEQLCLLTGSNLQVLKLAETHISISGELNCLRPFGFMISFFSHHHGRWEAAFFDAEDAWTMETWIHAIEIVQQPELQTYEVIDDFTDSEDGANAGTLTHSGLQILDSSRVGYRSPKATSHEKKNCLMYDTDATTPSEIGDTSLYSTDSNVSQCSKSKSNSTPAQVGACKPASDADQLPSSIPHFYIDDESDYEDDDAVETSSWLELQDLDWSAVIGDMGGHCEMLGEIGAAW